MSKWTINGTAMEIGPAEDTGWIVETVTAEHHPPTATFTILQLGGTKSATREIKGIVKSAADKALLEGARNTVTTIVDHNGVSSSAYWKELKFQEILDITNLGATFSWNATLIKR